MYVYFDKIGTLKEIINDEALRQGNFGVNKIYVYVDNGLGASKLYTDIDVKYLLPDGTTIVGPQNFDTFTNPDASDNSDCFIPYDAKRDLRYFKYGQPYKFCVIDIEPDVGEDENTLGESPLSQNGVVHCEMSLNLSDAMILALGDLNFMVEGASVDNLGQVGEEKYLSLANYLYLRSLFGEYVPYTGASSGINLNGQNLSNIYQLDASTGSFGDVEGGDYIDISSDAITSFIDGNDTVFKFADEGGTKTIASREWVNSQLPTSGVCATFSTGDFELDENTNNYHISNIAVSDFIEGSNMLIITWGNCFALCPIPADGGVGRVCAAMWNSSGEAQTIRIRYQLKDNNTKLDIGLQGGFTPPNNYTAYVQCIKLF